MKRLAAITIALLCLTGPHAFAGNDPLELTLGGSYNDTEGVGESTTLSAEGLAKFGPGVGGPSVAYSYDNPDKGKSVSGTAFGAAYEIGVGKDRIVPFGRVQALWWTGDIGEDRDGSVSVGGGIKTGGEGGFLKVYGAWARHFGREDVDSKDVTVALGYRF